MPSLIPLDSLLGAAYVGVIVSTVIYGVTCLQVYLYYTEHCSNDGRFVKVFVAALMLLDTLHVVLLAHFLYHYTITNFGDYAALVPNMWSILVEVVIGDLLSTLVQFFFAYRVYCLSKKRIVIPALVCLLSLGQLSCAFGFTITSFHLRSFANSHSDIPWTTASISAEVACDALITGLMIYYLRKGRTQFQKTNRAINLLITYSLNTSLLTTVFAVTTLITFMALHESLAYAAFFFILVRLYSCSFMSTLNSRSIVRQQLNGKDDEVITLSKFAAAEAQASQSRDKAVGGLAGGVSRESI